MTGIHVELVDGKIRLTGWDGPGTATRCKAVGGGRFQPKTGVTPVDGTPAHWTFPLDLSTCRALRVQFPDLTIGPNLNQWAHKAKAESTETGQLALADNADLFFVPPLAPKMCLAMSSRTYQRVAAAWGARVGSFLLADQQGLGKSIETLATIIESAGRTDRTQWHLVFSPSVAVETVWTAEVLRWLHDTHVAVLPLTGPLAKRQETLQSLIDHPGDPRHIFVVTNIEAARIRPSYDDAKDPGHKKPKYVTEDALVPALHSIVWDTVIVDECQRALIRTTGKLNQTRAGFQVLSKNSHRRIALSGTPMRGKPEQLWGTLNWLRPDLYRSYWNWVKRYFNLTSNGFSNYILNGFQPGGEERLAEDLRSIMLRRTKAEVLPDLPPKTYAGTYLDPNDENGPLGIWLDPLPKQLKQIEAMERDGFIGTDDDEILVNGSLAVYTRQKQLANGLHEIKDGRLVPTLESPKYEWLVEFLAELDGEKVVVASQFTSVIDAWSRGFRDLGYDVAVLTGKTPAAKRREMVEAFQGEGGPQVFMLNTKAGGVALTLDAADYMVLVDETTVPDDQEQVEDRIHRTSRIHNVTIYYLRTLGTLDEEVAWIAAVRMNVQQYLMDGARGVKAARALYQQNTQRKGA